MQRSPALAARERRVGCRRLFERALVEGHDGVHRRVQLVDPLEVVGQQLATADLAGAQPSREPGPVLSIWPPGFDPLILVGARNGLANCESASSA